MLVAVDEFFLKSKIFNWAVNMKKEITEAETKNRQARIKALSSGRKIIFCAIVVQLLSVFLTGYAMLLPMDVLLESLLAGYVSVIQFGLILVGMGISLFGIYQSCRGLGYGWVKRVPLLLSPFVPIVNWLVLLLVGFLAVKGLKGQSGFSDSLREGNR